VAAQRRGGRRQIACLLGAIGLQHEIDLEARHG
jgi:hypothetical protein